MAKLTGKAKAEFLKRMEKGRRKATRNGSKKPARSAKKSRRPSPKPKRAAVARKKKNTQLAGRAKAEFLKRMAKGRKAAARAISPKKKKARRRNSEGGIDAAVRKFEEFHGKPPGKIIDYDEQTRYRANFAQMGKLKELRFDLDALNRDFPLKDFAGAQAVCTPDGSNIYFIAGNQRIDLGRLNISSDKDTVELGSCTYIKYHTVKGFHDFEPTDYWHRFGEVDGIKPVLVYDQLNKSLCLLGGNYRVRPEGIVN
jgi:hypothetical protein